MNFALQNTAIDPIHQFQVTKWLDLRLGSIDISFTNASGFMLLGVVLCIAFFGYAASKKALVPGRTQSIAEIGYGFVADMVRSTAGEEGLRFFPFVFTLFFFVFFANMIGMVPYAFTTTSPKALPSPTPTRPGRARRSPNTPRGGRPRRSFRFCGGRRNRKAG